jgi:hypothetical protein
LVTAAMTTQQHQQEQETTTNTDHHRQQQWSSLLCGLAAGVAQAGLFNPYDRALYLSVRDDRKFLHRSNWTHPYMGFLQSLSTRAIAGGLYFPAEYWALQLVPHLAPQHPQRQHMLAGLLAGTVNAIVLNPLTAVKYKTWEREINRGVWHEALHMAQTGSGWRPFVKGLGPTILRDSVFGGTYTVLRLQIVESDMGVPTYAANLFAAALATIVSGPFNYVRTVQFATPNGDRAPTVPTVLHDLYRECMAVNGAGSGAGAMTVLSRRLHFVQIKLRIGWGTARVALGMSFAHAVYDWLHVRTTSGDGGG